MIHCRLRLALSLVVTSFAALLILPAIRGAQSKHAAPAPAAEAPTHDPAHYTRMEQVKFDWGWLGRFKEADLAIPAPKANEKRVVFMGDSITDFWPLDQSFPGKPYINRGISGQTTPQMVLRFHQDVIALKPKVVVLLAGTNDIAGNTGPMTLEETESNLAAMAEMASANHIRVVLCSVLPAYDYSWRPGLEPAPKIVAINKWIKAYAAKHHHVYVDYHTAMADARGGLPEKLSQDGVHPLPAGYAVMAPLAQAGIEKALKATR